MISLTSWITRGTHLGGQARHPELAVLQLEYFTVDGLLKALPQLGEAFHLRVQSVSGLLKQSATSPWTRERVRTASASDSFSSSAVLCVSDFASCSPR
jgi:hypothetical protein